MMQTQPLEVVDFSGGITDYFIDGKQNQAEKIDNLWLNPNRKPVTRWGSDTFVKAQLPLGTFRTNYMSFLKDEMLVFQEKHGYFKQSPTSWSELTGPTGNPIFNLGNTNSHISSSEYREQLLLANDSYASIQKVYKDSLNNLKAVNASLPAITGNPTVSNPAGTGAAYAYAFVLVTTYMVGNTTFITRGAVKYVGGVSGGTITTGNGAGIIIPADPVQPTENWDKPNIKTEVYRTIDAGTEFYRVTTLNYGVTAYTDEMLDATLLSQVALYTNGGLLDADQAPKTKYVHVVNGLGYYARLETDSNIIYQSIPGIPDGVPQQNFNRTEQEIFGLSSIFDRPIVACRDYVYRIDNQFFSDGTGAMELRRIDDKAGCVSNNSFVQTHLGLFWAGVNGFYWTDGFKVMKITDNLNETYKKFVLNTTRARRIFGTYDASNERVIWAVCKENGDNEADVLYSLDLKMGVKPESTFTTLSGDYFRPVVIGVANKMLYRGDTRGYVLEHSPDYFTDPKINEIINPTLWDTATIIHTYKSCFLDFGSKFMRKFVPRILVSAANTTNLAIAIHSSNDNNRVQGDLKPIEYNSNVTWGDILPVWGDPLVKWNSQGIIEEWRRFPADGLRCQYKQITITNAKVKIINSDLLGPAILNTGAKTATLTGTFEWIPNCVDYVISFESDNYTREYLIKSRTNTTVVYDDLQNTSVSGSQKWVIRGKPKGQVLELNGYVLHWSYISKSHTPFTSQGGGNPA